jgi:hypothetical protein
MDLATMNKSKILQRIFVILVLSVVPVISWAYDFQYNGIYYNYTSNDEVCVTFGVTPYSGSVNIPSSFYYDGCRCYVTSIGYSAFYGCSGLTSITIPNSVTSIADDAFEGCTSLPIIDNLRYADTYLVEAVDKTLSTYNIKEGTRFIGNKVFQDCLGIKSFTIPNSVTTIGNSAFVGCSRLTSIIIPNSVANIGLRAFEGCTSLPVKDDIRYADTYLIEAVDKTKSTYNIRKGTRFIGSSAFSNCSNLTSITIPNSVTSIGSGAFVGCSRLTKSEFSSIENLCKISFSENRSNPLYYAKHLYINGQEVKDLVIPNSVTSIGVYAFSGCSGLKSVTIPNSVTSIGYSAFYGCSGLTSITIGNGVTSIAEGTFSGCSGLTSVTIPNNVTSIGVYAFVGCSGLSSVTIGNGVTSIADGTFSGCSGLKSVTIPNSVTSIGGYAFSGCTGLTSITIPNSVKNIDSWAFKDCSGLTSLIIGNGMTRIYGNPFSGCSSLSSVTLGRNMVTIEDGVFYDSPIREIVCLAKTVPQIYSHSFTSHKGVWVYVPTSALYDYHISWGKYFYNILDINGRAASISINQEDITIPKGYSQKLIATIEPESATQTIEWTSSNTDVAIVDRNGSVKGISYGTAIITATTTVGIPLSASCKVTVDNLIMSGKCGDNLTYSLYDDYRLAIFGMGKMDDYNSLSDIPWKDYVSQINAVEINVGVTKVGGRAFSNCTNITSVVIPEGVTAIGDFAFYNCSGINSATIGSHVKIFGVCAFYGCLNLKTVTCAVIDVPEVDDSFMGVPQSTATLYVPETSVNAYKTAYEWKEFGNIVGIDPTAVEELKSNKTSKANKNAPIYDLMGRRLQQKPASGYYIQGGKKFFVK